VPGDEPAFRTVIVDDHELLRAGTRGILEEASGFEVVGEAADAESAHQVVAETHPDLVIADIRLPTANGIDLAARLVDDHPALVVVILSAYDDEHYVRAAMAAGVSGYLLKTMPSHELVAALREACTGGGLTGGPLGHGEKDSVDDPTSEPLTARETAVVRLVARGMSNKAIAQQLGISPRTVEGHVNHVFDKLGVFSRTELVHYALANRLFVRGTPAADGPGDGGTSDDGAPAADGPSDGGPSDDGAIRGSPAGADREDAGGTGSRPGPMGRAEPEDGYR
jgi:DNA-binding NarL/FixJ family response regulator